MTDPIQAVKPELQEVNDRLDRVEAALDRMGTRIESLLNAWNTASGVVKFVKWLGGLAMAMTAIWAMIRVALGGKL